MVSKPIALVFRQKTGCKQYTFQSLEEISKWCSRKPYKLENIKFRLIYPDSSTTNLGEIHASDFVEHVKWFLDHGVERTKETYSYFKQKFENNILIDGCTVGDQSMAMEWADSKKNKHHYIYHQLKNGLELSYWFCISRQYTANHKTYFLEFDIRNLSAHCGISIPCEVKFLGSERLFHLSQFLQACEASTIDDLYDLIAAAESNYNCGIPFHDYIPF